MDFEHLERVLEGFTPEEQVQYLKTVLKVQARFSSRAQQQVQATLHIIGRFQERFVNWFDVPSRVILFLHGVILPLTAVALYHEKHKETAMGILVWFATAVATTVGLRRMHRRMSEDIDKKLKELLTGESQA